jgi:hypothetical protein
LEDVSAVTDFSPGLIPGQPRLPRVDSYLVAERTAPVPHLGKETLLTAMENQLGIASVLLLGNWLWFRIDPT